MASANPATAPEQPAAGISLTAKTVPDVSILGAAQHDLRGLRRRIYAGDQHRAPSMIMVIRWGDSPTKQPRSSNGHTHGGTEGRRWLEPTFVLVPAVGPAPGPDLRPVTGPPQ